MTDLKYFCLFIGYPYSGHSLVGSIIDAHPNAVISHELHIGRLVKKGFSKEKIFSMIILNSMSYAEHERRWNNYTYAIPDEWNGRYSSIQVIGDKKGGKSTKLFTNKTEVFDIVDTNFGIPVKYIHVIRNPYDMVSTFYRKTKSAGEDKLKKNIEKCLIQIERVEKLRKEIKPENWLDFYYEQFLLDTAASIQSLFRFFELETPSGFIENCMKILYKKPHHSRFDILWKDEDIEYFSRELSLFSRFSCYSYNS